MIGQRELLKKIEGQIQRGKFPRVSILIGEKGSGRKTLARKITTDLKCGGVFLQAAEEIVALPDVGYDIHSDIVYIFPDAELLSGESIEILSKLIVNIPEKSYIIITCNSLNNIPSEIKSNAVTYMMESYSYEDKCDYIKYIVDKSEDDIRYILDVASNIGEMNELCNLDLDEFRESVKFALEDILQDKPFRIYRKIAFHDEDDKLPMYLFWRAFNSICADNLNDNPLLYCKFIAVTGEALQSSVTNKMKVFDDWLDAIRDKMVLQ